MGWIDSRSNSDGSGRVESSPMTALQGAGAQATPSPHCPTLQLVIHYLPSHMWQSSADCWIWKFLTFWKIEHTRSIARASVYQIKNLAVLATTISDFSAISFENQHFLCWGIRPLCLLAFGCIMTRILKTRPNIHSTKAIGIERLRFRGGNEKGGNDRGGIN